MIKAVLPFGPINLRRKETNMARYRICVLIIAFFVFPSLCYAQGSKDPIVGTWKLISIERLKKGEEVLGPDSSMGKNPTGLIIFDTSGYFSEQILAEGKDVVDR
jgi:hypothetical protein